MCVGRYTHACTHTAIHTCAHRHTHRHTHTQTAPLRRRRDRAATGALGAAEGAGERAAGSLRVCVCVHVRARACVRARVKRGAGSCVRACVENIMQRLRLSPSQQAPRPHSLRPQHPLASLLPNPVIAGRRSSCTGCSSCSSGGVSGVPRFHWFSG